jgi:mono/diheme cytochrome c family protein
MKKNGEQEDPTRFYKPRSLNKWFFISSFVFMASIIGMLVHDFVRPWKAIQETFNAINLKKIDENIKAAAEKQSADAMKAAQDLVDEKKKELADKQSDIRQLAKEKEKLRGIWEKANQEYRHKKAVVDVVKYDFEVAHHEHPDSPKTHKMEEDLHHSIEQMNALQKGDEIAKANLDAADAKIAEFRMGLDQAEKDFIKLNREMDLLKKKRAKVDDPLFFFRNGPMTDFIAPSMKIQQIVLDGIRYNNNFTTVGRVDRCQTCHTTIDQKGFEDQPNPWKTHPNLDVYLGPKSPHPLGDVGCTVCHGGQGESVDFNYASHTPHSKEQEEEWARPVKVIWSKELKKIVNSRICAADSYKETESCKEFFAKGKTVGGYGWERLHYWDFPQLPLNLVEANCQQCHSAQRFVNKAPHYNEGIRLAFEFGCYGCHKVERLGTDLPKPAPSLRHIKGKLSKEWVIKWIYNPWDFNPRSRMPRFFGLANNSLNEREVAWQKEEALALAETIWDMSEEYKPTGVSVPKGNGAHGKQLVGELGCLGCHASSDFAQAENLFAPHLNNLGSKLNRAWLVDWLKDPKRYHPETRMPVLRLSQSEIADIADYLLSQHNTEFEQKAVYTSDAVARDEVLQRYYEATMSPEAAKAKVESLPAGERQKELGGLVLTRYGCWGCHDLKGYEKALGIGAELSNEGSKLISKFDFGHQHQIPHTKQDWIYNKINSPRMYDEGRVLKWTDRSRMPQFFWREGHVDKLTLAVMSWADNSAIPDNAKVQMTRQKHAIEEGRRITHNKNCVGCHYFIPEERGGEILSLYEDKTLGPPRFNLQGEKLHPEWFKQFLTSVRPIRPWLKVRMPSFHWTPEELDKVIGYFNALDNQPFPWYSDEARKLVGSDLAQAEALFKDLNCQSCHVLGEIPKGADTSSLAPNLKLAKKRLRVSWMRKWIEAPAKIISDTRMPAFWYRENEEDPKSPLVTPYPKYFGGDAKKQIEMMAHYLYTIGYDDYWGGTTKPASSGEPSAVTSVPPGKKQAMK